MRVFISIVFVLFVIIFSIITKFVKTQYNYEIDFSESGEEVKNFWYSTGKIVLDCSTKYEYILCFWHQKTSLKYNLYVSKMNEEKKI